MIDRIKATAERAIEMNRPVAGQAPTTSFVEVTALIEVARGKAFQAVNTVLIELYWRIGETLSRKIEAAENGETASLTNWRCTSPKAIPA